MKRVASRIIREPLLHFAVLGAVLFGIFYVLNPDQLGSKADPKTVVVDEPNLLKFLQFQMKAFDGKLVKTRFEAMSKEKKDEMVKKYIREEVLYREALSLGFDKSDYVIKRRMIQKLNFITKGFTESMGSPSDQFVRDYFEKNKKDYFVEPWVTFTHVFFDKKRLGVNKTKELAQQKLNELNQKKAIFSDAVKHGSRFPYHTNYVERTPGFVTSHFGKKMAGALFQLEPSKTKWHGPFTSPFGSHVVMLAARREGRIPVLNEVRRKVEMDARLVLVRERTEKTIRKIIDSYTIEDRLNLLLNSASSGSAQAAQR